MSDCEDSAALQAAMGTPGSVGAYDRRAFEGVLYVLVFATGCCELSIVGTTLRYCCYKGSQ